MTHGLRNVAFSTRLFQLFCAAILFTVVISHPLSALYLSTELPVVRVSAETPEPGSSGGGTTPPGGGGGARPRPSPPPPKHTDPPQTKEPRKKDNGSSEGNGGKKDRQPDGKPEYPKGSAGQKEPESGGSDNGSETKSGEGSSNSNAKGNNNGGGSEGNGNGANAGGTTNGAGKTTSGQEGNAQGKNEGTGEPLSLGAIIGIGVGAGLAAILAIALLIYAVRKRSIARSNSNYFRFPDADETPMSTIQPASAPRPPSAGSGLSATSAVTAASAAAATAIPPDPPVLIGSAVGVAESKHGTSQFGERETAGIGQHQSMLEEHRPSAPSASQFTRRDSIASSASSDTIVAPEFGTVPSEGNIPPYWFSDSSNGGTGGGAGSGPQGGNQTS